MQAVVSLLDDDHYLLTETLWRELDTTFGLRGVYTTPHPHFSYHVARSYAPELLRDRLNRLARSTSPFQVKASGLGIFTGCSPVLYIPVVRSPGLTQFHQALCAELATCAAGSASYYLPDAWMPHITIGFGDMPGDVLAEAVRLLAARDFNWTITMDNLAHIVEDGEGAYRLGFRLDFKGYADESLPGLLP
jgi:hypothetical protein